MGIVKYPGTRNLFPGFRFQIPGSGPGSGYPVPCIRFRTRFRIPASGTASGNSVLDPVPCTWFWNRSQIPGSRTDYVYPVWFGPGSGFRVPVLISLFIFYFYITFSSNTCLLGGGTSILLIHFFHIRILGIKHRIPQVRYLQSIQTKNKSRQTSIYFFFNKFNFQNKPYCFYVSCLIISARCKNQTSAATCTFLRSLC